MSLKLYLAVFLLQVITLKVFSQEVVTVPEFGKVSVAELQMKDCDFEKGVAAMHLLKYEDVNFTGAESGYYKVVTQKRFRVKIFNANGFKLANVGITYTGGDRDFKITDVEAITYNLDEQGQVKISKLASEEIFKDKGEKKKSVTSLRFTLPDVKAGCIIEYRYTIIAKESKYIAPWYFQDEIPNLLSACKISVPLQSALTRRIIGIDSVEEGSQIDDAKGYEKRKLIKSFSLRNVPSFKSEPFMSSSKDYKQKVEFILDSYETVYEATLRESNKSWERMNIMLLGSPFGWQFNITVAEAQSFVDSVKNIGTVAEKVNAVYTYVKKQVKWNEYYTIYNGSIQAALKNKEGTSGDINLLILNLLRKAGVDCYPAIFSTRSHGKTDLNFASLSQFNSVDIIAIDGDQFYVLDGTQKYLPYNITPYNVLSRDAFIIDPQFSKWVNITNPRSLIRDSVAVIASIDNDGVLKGQTFQTFYDLSKAIKIEEDEKKKNNNEDDDNDNEETLIGSDIKTDSSYQLNKDSILLPLIEGTKFHYELPSTDEFYFLSPFLFSGLSKNPFTDSLRRSDIDFGSGIIHTVHMEITVPENINVEELIRNKTIRTGDTSMKFSCVAEYKNNVVIINSSFEINRPIFAKEEYDAVRFFFRNIYTLLNNQVLLKRKQQ